jgi:hypothetical protein
VCVGAALEFSVAAMLNVQGDGARWHVFTRGPLAGRDCFTRTGWIFRNLALLSGLCAPVFLFLESPSS